MLIRRQIQSEIKLTVHPCSIHNHPVHPPREHVRQLWQRKPHRGDAK
jgi:hypothetical protein